jgi:hypothetical protein
MTGPEDVAHAARPSRSAPGATAMIAALVRLKLAGFVRTGRALAPLLALVAIVGILYGGGDAQASEAYGMSAAVTFPLLAWQTQILLNAEPDVQRRLAVVAVGGLRREMAAGLAAAAVTGLALITLALALPWMFGGITGPVRPEDPGLADGVIAGGWAHLLLLPPALALGAVASRAAVGNAARGVVVLTAGAVFGFVLGIKGSPVPWLVPPLLSTSRATVHGLAVGSMVEYTVQAVLWTAVVLGGYTLLRRRNT